MSETDPPEAEAFARPESSESPRELPEQTRKPLEILDMSPSVRRLVRQYDIDITGIRGTGPEGRLRPSDILAIVSGADPAPVSDDDLVEPGTDRRSSSASLDDDERAKETERLPAHGTVSGVSIHACDMSRVLADRRQSQSGPAALISYYALAAATAAVKLGLLSGGAGIPRLSIVEIGADGGVKRSTLRRTTEMKLAAVEAAIAASQPPDAERAPLTLFMNSGSAGIIELPPPIDDGEMAVVGIGGINRVVGVRTVDGQDAPRIFSQSYLSLGYRPAALTPADASRLLAECVRTLENWPSPPRGEDGSAAGGS